MANDFVFPFPPQAVQFLPTLQGDLGSLVPSAVEAGPAEAVWTTSGCAFHKVRRRGMSGGNRRGPRGGWVWEGRCLSEG